MRTQPSHFLGAAFLMATSAVGPGFLTQTTVFTVQLGAGFAFVILLSVLLDLGAQINIWRVVTAAGQPAPALASDVLPGLGYVLTLLVAFGGLAFNIGNVAGTGLGWEVCTGLPASWGAVLSSGLAVGLFIRRDAGRAVDGFSRALGLLMILLTAWIAISAQPRLGEAVKGMFFPEKIDLKAVLTLVGGTVGGYISFAGAHRLLEAGVHGAAQVPAATRSAFAGIGVATLMRLLLFLAAWGVVGSGAVVDTANPPASVFRIASGEWGYRFFGLVMWSAAITSVVGATFTSLSFLAATFPFFREKTARWAGVFVGISLGVFLWVGKPVSLLLWAGLLNGLILPIGLAAMLLVARRPDLMGGYRLPFLAQVIGWAVVLVMGIMAVLHFCGIG